MEEIIEKGITYCVEGGVKWMKTAPARIRKIKPDLFPARFSFSEKVRMKSSPDPIVQVFWDEAIVVKRPYIDLDHPDLNYALPYLRDTQHPTTGEYYLDGATAEERQVRMDAILADGSDEERA
jgi:hypothetical protein